MKRRVRNQNRMELSCRWCGVGGFASRNKLFAHVRASPSCAGAAADDDQRATEVLARSSKPKMHAAAFLVKNVCGQKEKVEQCLALGLAAVGAEEVETRCTAGLDQTNQAGTVRHSVFVARFICPCACNDVLRDIYFAITQPDIAGHSCADLRLVSAVLVQGGHKFNMGELCARDYSALFPALNVLASARTVDLISNITVVFTTSPMRSDPELDVLERAFASLSLAGLEQCPKILMCDHFTATNDPPGTKKVNLKAGCLPREYVERYHARLAQFKKAEWSNCVQVVELPKWHGFALATQQALKLVQTPLVMIIQHDLAFLRKIDLLPVAAVLLGERENCALERVNFVNFPRSNQVHHG